MLTDAKMLIETINRHQDEQEKLRKEFFRESEKKNKRNQPAEDCEGRSGDGKHCNKKDYKKRV